MLWILACSLLPWPTWAGMHTHGDGFQPDEILRVTLEKVPVACRWRESAVVNGSSPGPPLRIKPNKTTWVRVYNDMPTENLTMVTIYPFESAEAEMH